MMSAKIFKGTDAIFLKKLQGADGDDGSFGRAVGDAEDAAADGQHVPEVGRGHFDVW